MMFLRQSTASQEVLLGPFLDDTDGKTAETGLTIANTDIKIWKRGGTTEASKNSGGATHIASGRYYCVLDATDTDTVGELAINVHVSGALPVRLVCCVLEEAVFDSLFAASAAGYQVPIWSSASATVNLSGTTIATSQQIASVSGAVGSVTGAVGSVTGNVGGSVASVTGRVTANTDQWNGVTVTGMPMPTYTQPTGFLAATFPTTVASTTNITTVGAVSGAVGSVTGNVGGNVSGSVGSISGVTFPTNLGVLGINASGHVSRVTLVDTTTTNTDMRGTDNAALASIWTSTVAGRIDATISSRSSHSAADVWSVTTRTLSAFSFSVTVGTNNDKAGYSLATAPLDASGTAAAVWGALLASYTTAGTFGGRVVRSDSSNVLVKLTGSAHIAADIHELQPAVIQASHFDLGAIDANALASDAASEIATSVWSAATRTLTAFSFAITVDAASIRSAIGLASANLDTQLDAIPTAAEIDTQLTTSHGAGSWAVGGTGSGAYTLTLTVNDGASALQNATVRMVEGVNAYVGQTNASGVVAFSLDAATYSVAITKDGYSFTPTTKAVSATGSQTYSMTQITPTPPAAPGLSTGTAICYGTTGLPLAGVVVTVQQVDGKGTAGSAYDGDTFTLTSNAQGTITHNGFVRGAVYSIRRGIRGEAKSFTVPDAASFDLSEIVGRD